MKYARIILLCLLCLNFSTACTTQNGREIIVEPGSFADAQQKIKEERVAALNKSVFCISIVVKGKDFERKISVGTAFLVADYLLASAFHVQTRAEELSRYFKTSTYTIVAWKRLDADEIVEFPIERTLFNRENDLAIYQFNSKILRENPKTASLKPLALAENLPPVGAEVVSIAYYGDYEYPFHSFGNVSMIDVNEDIVSDVTLMSGNSGGPLCALRTGEVLGINTSVMTLGNNTVRFGFAKRASKLKMLLPK